MSEEYFEWNKQSWNDRVEPHMNSDFYQMDDFLNGKNSLQPIELKLLGDLNGKKVLHLQCHFGQDSISMSRMGANVVGVDLSDKAIENAQILNERLNCNAQFICCNLYDLPLHLNEEFDIVFTSYGTYGWLPDLEKWAKIVTRFLKKGGVFVMVDFHPVIWMFDDNYQKIIYPYFNREPIIEEVTGTYADKNAKINNKTVGWNHGLSEIIKPLLQNGLQLIDFDEYDYSPYPCFNPILEISPGKYKFAPPHDGLPMVFSLKMRK